MKRQDYFPPRIGNQVQWLHNLAVKLPKYTSDLELEAGDVTAAVNDANWGAYVLGIWLSAVRAFAPSTTDGVDQALTGPLLTPGTTAITMPTFTAPTLPNGVTAQPPGLLTRLFALIALIKKKPGYTEAIGSDLGTEGAEDAEEKATPKFLTSLLQGDGQQSVSFTFYKYGHQGVYIESRRGPNGVWEFLAIDTESPYVDERPLLVAGQPEQREYRMRFWDKGTPNGDWTDVQKVTVSP
jgi:hypothetical protein